MFRRGERDQPCHFPVLAAVYPAFRRRWPHENSPLCHLMRNAVLRVSPFASVALASSKNTLQISGFLKGISPLIRSSCLPPPFRFAVALVRPDWSYPENLLGNGHAHVFSSMASPLSASVDRRHESCPHSIKDFFRPVRLPQYKQPKAAECPNSARKGGGVATGRKYPCPGASPHQQRWPHRQSGRHAAA